MPAATENCPVPRHESPVHICHRQGSLKELILNSDSSNEWKHLVNHVADSAAWCRNRADRPLPCHGWPAAIIMIINGGFSTDLARSSPFLSPTLPHGRTDGNERGTERKDRRERQKAAGCYAGHCWSAKSESCGYLLWMVPYCY